MRSALLPGLCTVLLTLAAGPSAAQEPQPSPAPAPAASPALDEAKAAFKANDFPKAFDAAEKALAENPKNLAANYIAGTSAVRLGNFAAGEKYLGAAEAENPSMLGLNYQLANLAFAQAEAAEKGGKPEDAKPAYRKAAERCVKESERKAAQQSPFFVPALALRAVALLRAGDVDESQKAHEAWIAAVPNDPGPFTSLGKLYAKNGRGNDALALIEKLPEQDAKGRALLAYSMAQAFYSEDDFSWAHKISERCSVIDPASSRCLALNIASHAEMGQLQEAADTLKQYMALNPPSDEADKVAGVFDKHFGAGTTPAPLADGTNPVVERVPEPRYPKAALHSNVEASVLVVAQVRKDGTIGETFLLPSRIQADLKANGFEDAAFDTVRRGRYKAGSRNGQPADLWVTVPLRFRP